MADKTIILDAGDTLTVTVNAPAVDPVVEVDTKTESGAQETFVPEAPTA